MLEVTHIPCWYVVLAVFVSAYQAYRGFMFQWIGALEKKTVEDNGATDIPCWYTDQHLRWTRPQKIFLLCIADMLTYLITTLAGFVALFMSYYILERLPSLDKIGAGLSALLIFLAIFGLLGVSGKLPYLIDQGKVFPWKQ